MEMVVTVTLLKDAEGKYALNLNKSTVTVAQNYDNDGALEPVNVRWLLREDEANPDFPNARKLTVTFNTLPTPFTITSANDPLPNAEVYATAAFSSGVGTADVQDADVLLGDSDVLLYKYTITVETNDNQQIVLDPHVRMRRGHVTRGDIFSR